MTTHLPERIVREHDTVRAHLVANISIEYDLDRMLPAFDSQDFGYLMDAPESMPAGSCYGYNGSTYQSRASRR